MDRIAAIASACIARKELTPFREYLWHEVGTKILWRYVFRIHRIVKLKRIPAIHDRLG